MFVFGTRSNGLFDLKILMGDKIQNQVWFKQTELCVEIIGIGIE